MTENEIREEVAKKYNISEKKLNFILNEFFYGLNYYLTHPLEAKYGINIPFLCTFYIKKYKVEKFLEKMKDNDSIDRDFYNKLLNIIK